MGTWSAEFINLKNIPLVDLRAAGGLAVWIARRVAPTANPSGRRIVLYFPPRPTPGLDTRRTDAWVLESAAALVLPSEVEVMVAPGARIVLWGATRLEIRGAFTAPVAQVFDVPRFATPSSPGVGEVQLLGDRIECVYPEWWGAGRGDAEADTEALQRAVYVALRRPRPLPIELLGRYTLRRPLSLGVPETSAPHLGVELRGRFSVGDACIQASDDFRGDAMVLVPYTSQSSLLHAVSFDAKGRVKYCVEVRLAGQHVTQVTRAPHTLRQCSFRGATEAQVVAARFEPAGSTSDPQTTSHAPRLLAQGCVFTPTATSVGVRLNGSPDAVAAFSGCTFVGEALAMVHVMGQGATLTNCRFHNTMVPTRLRGIGGVIAWEGVHRSSPEGGLDIFVDREAATVLVLRVTGLTLAQAAAIAATTGSIGLAIAAAIAGGINVRTVSPRRLLGALGWITEQDCRSSSLQHIAVAEHTPAPTERGPRDSVLIGVHHACNPMPSTLARSQLPPAILWRAPTPQGGALSLTGCRFDGLDRGGKPRVIVIGSPVSTRPALFEYGTCSRDRIVRTGAPGVDNADVFDTRSTIGRIPLPP